MRVLFLDMDGVMNSSRWLNETFAERNKLVGELLGFDQWMRNFTSMIDPDAVPLLDEIIERSAAHVVICSSWRVHFTADQIAKMLAHHGGKFADRFIGRTPNNVLLPNGVAYARGHEIQAWLDEHPDVKTFIILDDSTDMAHLLPRLVHTTWVEGLKHEHVERAVAMLNEEK